MKGTVQATVADAYVGSLHARLYWVPVQSILLATKTVHAIGLFACLCLRQPSTHRLKPLLMPRKTT